MVALDKVGATVPYFGVSPFAACTVALISVDESLKKLIASAPTIMGCAMVVVDPRRDRPGQRPAPAR